MELKVKIKLIVLIVVLVLCFGANSYLNARLTSVLTVDIVTALNGGDIETLRLQKNIKAELLRFQNTHFVADTKSIILLEDWDYFLSCSEYFENLVKSFEDNPFYNISWETEQLKNSNVTAKTEEYFKYYSSKKEQKDKRVFVEDNSLKILQKDLVFQNGEFEIINYNNFTRVEYKKDFLLPTCSQAQEKPRFKLMDSEQHINNSVITLVDMGNKTLVDVTIKSVFGFVYDYDFGVE